jgi:hypothetical protein
VDGNCRPNNRLTELFMLQSHLSSPEPTYKPPGFLGS